MTSADICDQLTLGDHESVPRNPGNPYPYIRATYLSCDAMPPPRPTPLDYSVQSVKLPRKP